MQPLLIGLLGFAIQLVFCFFTKKKAIRCIPLYLLFAGILFATASYVGIFGRYSVGAISGNELTGLIILIAAAIFATGIAFAWLVYGLFFVYRHISNKKNSSNVNEG